MSIMVERLERTIKGEIARQAENSDALLFDPVSGLIDGAVDIHAVARGIAEALRAESLNDAPRLLEAA